MTKSMLCMILLWFVLFTCVAVLMLMHLSLQRNLTELQVSLNKTHGKLVYVSVFMVLPYGGFDAFELTKRTWAALRKGKCLLR